MKKKHGCLTAIIAVIVVFLAIGAFSGGSDDKPQEPTTSASASVSDDAKTNKGEETAPDAPEQKQPEAEPEPADTRTTGQKNALKSANQYLNYSAFSRSGLIKQLEYEGYSTEDATYAVDNCGASWTEQALKSAKSYLAYSSFSHSGLIHQLEYEGFSTEDATYGADNCGADWNEQAAKTAKSYMDYSSFSKSGLIDQLEYEGFTAEQAAYGASAVGY